MIPSDGHVARARKRQSHNKMLIPIDAYAAAWDNVRRTGRLGSDAKVLLLVAMDADAVCAAKIVADLLRRDCLRFSLLAVETLQHMDEVLEDMLASPSSTGTTSVFMFNCGGLVDLEARYPV